MNILRHTESDFARRRAALAGASSLFDPAIEDRAREIIAAVRARGNAALLEFTGRFDGARLTAEQLAVTQAELMAASLAADVSLRRAVAEADKNVANCAKKSLRRDWECKNAQGALVSVSRLRPRINCAGSATKRAISFAGRGLLNR